MVPSGVYSTKQLLTAFGRQQFNTAVRLGEARQLRRGWYAVGTPSSSVVSAVTSGGVLSCVSALEHWGLWVPRDGRTHIRGNSWAVQHRRGPFCRRFGRPEPEYGPIDDVETALQYAARCLDAEGFVVVCDSALNNRLVTMDQLEYQFRGAPKAIQRLLDRCDARAESGPETIIRLFLRSLNVPFELQVSIPQVGRVDILVGRWLIVELDGWEFHGDRAHFASDRVRDVNAHALGYTPLRFTCSQVLYKRTETTARIREAIRARAHARPSRRV